MATSVLDRVVRWNLDLDGDLYGDERERYRWYEGIAVAAQLQSILIPWSAAVVIWPLGETAVVPLTIMLVAFWLPAALGTVYVRSRKVETAPRGWSSKRVLLTAVTALPYGVFVAGAFYVHNPDSSTWIGAVLGGVVGAGIGVAALIVKGRQRERREALAKDDD
ncbi:hypothetical protein ODJ79_19005 [Actinoplanes sp. KI2]|uniref:hypothetical protein n=1 Tax=Actinoplanes sp. KI2 TaxID=2983315 RepID=UPI0021D56C27|nr:hypothetical protein [Actinoplanes sp. KI2]MCU7725823.1 hypothetical protein [Actinoplanes sp. KI2]